MLKQDEAAIIREGYKRVLDGEPLARIIADFNRRDVPTRMGKRWTAATLRSKLMRWTNCGVRTHRGKEMGRGKWPPIVDRQTHERLLAVLTDPARKTANRGTVVKYLLGGIVLCGECGSALASAKARTKTVTVQRKSGPESRERHFPAKYKCINPECYRVSRHMDELDTFVSDEAA